MTQPQRRRNQALAFAIAAFGFGAMLTAQSGTGIFLGSSGTPSAQAASGASTIRGHILAVDNGRPVRSARVQVSGPTLPTARVTMADASGAYEFRNLPAGRFTLSATAPAFIGLSYGQTRPFEAGKPIVVADKQQLDAVDLRLPRGGAIAGVILDDGGQPLINAVVVALRSQYVRGIRQLVQVGRAQSNDVGEYRIYGLPPGAYLVSASKGFALSPDWTVTAGSGFAPTFFPGTLSEATAARVDISLGQTRSGVTFSLDPAKAGSIGGATFQANGQPAMIDVAAPIIRPVNRADSALALPRMVLSGDGIHSGFLALGLPPGEYDVRAVSSAASGVAQGVAVRVSLNGDNITDLKLMMQPLPGASGRLVADPASTGPVPVAGVRMGLETVDPTDPRRFPQPAAPAADGTFTLYGPAGRARIRPVLPNGWALKAVRIKDEEITDTGFEFRDGEAIRDIEVELTNRLTTVSGLARNDKGELAGDYAVILFAQDRQRWTGDARYFATARPDQQGAFTISGLAPGDYFAAALDYLDPAEAQNPALLDRLQRDATRFALRDGEGRPLELKVVRP